LKFCNLKTKWKYCNGEFHFYFHFSHFDKNFHTKNFGTKHGPKPKWLII
jgi:hypothetical protein